MLRLGLLFIVMAFLYASSAAYSPVALRELSAVVEGESGALLVVGRLQYHEKDCSPMKTQAGIWADSLSKSPLSVRSRLGVGVGLYAQANDLWRRGCNDEAVKLFERSVGLYQQVIQLSSGDASNTARTHRMQASMNTATVFILLQEYDAARQVLNAALMERDAYLPAIVRLAEVELRSGNPKAALAVTDRLRGRPFEDIAGLSVGLFWAFRAEAHCQLGDAKQANWEIEKAHRSDPDIREARCEGKGD